MSPARKSFRKIATKESLLLLWLLFAGLVILPAFVYLIGSSLFGDYGGTGFSAFYGTLHSELREGDLAVWFLVLSPYLIWQFLRLTWTVFRRTGRQQQQNQA